MRLVLAWAVLCTPALTLAQEPAATAPPTVSVSAKAELLSDVLAGLHEQTDVLIAADPFTAERRVTVEIESKPLPEALDALAVAAVATWDAAYILIPNGGTLGPEASAAGWSRPPQVPVTLSGGSGPADKIAATLTCLSCAPVGYTPEVASVVVTTQAQQNASLEDVLSTMKGAHLTWTRGFWFAPIDRAAVFGRYASLPTAEREERVMRHVEQMLRLNKDDVR